MLVLQDEEAAPAQALQALRAWVSFPPPASCFLLFWEGPPSHPTSRLSIPSTCLPWRIELSTGTAWPISRYRRQTALKTRQRRFARDMATAELGDRHLRGRGGLADIRNLLALSGSVTQHGHLAPLGPALSGSSQVIYVVMSACPAWQGEAYCSVEPTWGLSGPTAHRLSTTLERRLSLDTV